MIGSLKFTSNIHLKIPFYCWTAGQHNDQNAIDQIKPEDKSVNILRIPAKTTGIIQPCDVFFFRMWKNFIKKFSDRVILDDLKVNLHDRNNLLKIQSLVHYQFSAPRFRDFIKYSWFKCGYVDQRPPKFKTPVEFCFNYDQEACFNDCSQCTDGVFIICAWCSNPLCFKHFFTDHHNCNNGK